ncbi:MAG TPA: histidine kinase dimerization/phospho-acceptor domain-containing protein [Pyrinomonadaceae bacterium]|nr:histidine kinase dimerization/phospho-acceptor domain-containing protein [Pyrinomonadaceae bacterium]
MSRSQSNPETRAAPIGRRRNAVESLKQQHAALEEENRELRRVAEHRSVSLAQLTHELRTPLTAILGFAEILLTQEELTKAQRNFCERIQSSAHQLHKKLNQLSEVSRIEAVQSELPAEPVFV